MESVSKIVDALEPVAGGKGPSGSETSHRFARLWLETLNVSGVKVTGGHQVVLSEGSAAVLAEDGSVKTPASQASVDWLLTVRIGGIESVVSLGMYAALAAYACFRPRTRELLVAMRSRGVQVGKELGLPMMHLSFCLPGSVALAMSVGRIERNAWATLGTRTGHFSQELASQFAEGTVHPTVSGGNPVIGFWQRTTARILGYGLTKELRLPGSRL
jgi:hypothetical protein